MAHRRIADVSPDPRQAAPRLATLALAALVFAALVFAALSAVAQEDVRHAADPRLSDDERTELVALLEKTRRDLLERVAGLSDEAFHFKPAPDRWSIAEVTEHLLLTEGIFFGRVEEAMAAPANPAWESETAGKEDRLFHFVPIRLRRFDAPEPATPKGSMSRRDLLQGFEKARSKTLSFVEENGPMKAHTVDSDSLGPVNAYQWALFAALHNLRHNEQILEVMAAPGFPHGDGCA